MFEVLDFVLFHFHVKVLIEVKDFIYGDFHNFTVNGGVEVGTSVNEVLLNNISFREVVLVRKMFLNLNVHTNVDSKNIFYVYSVKEIPFIYFHLFPKRNCVKDDLHLNNVFVVFGIVVDFDIVQNL